ncbi:MAG: carbohydrate binding domain-containing protein [Elusimicrobiota bacterium]
MNKFLKFFSLLLVAGSLVVSMGARKKVSTETDAPAAKTVSSAPGNYLDDMESTAGWDNYINEGVVLKLSSVPGKVGKALQVSYSMGSGTWLGICKELPQDLSKYSGVRFVFRGEGGKNTVEVKLEDADGSNFGKELAFKSNTGAWTVVEVPFSQMTYWWGGDQMLDLKKCKIHFAISVKEGDAGETGKVMIDNLEGYGTGTAPVLKGTAKEETKPAAAAPAPKIAGNVLDAMDSVTGWDKYVENTVTVNFAIVAGKTGKAIECTYDLTGGNYWGMWKGFSGDVSKYKGIKFTFRGEGSANSIEFKIEDMDGSNFGKILPMKSNTAAWTTVEVPFADLAYLWNGNQTLEYVDPKIHFAISKKVDDDKGGKGKFIVGQIELYK